jgi:aerobic carbon-monoxide dehydrogenase large subunit
MPARMNATVCKTRLLLYARSATHVLHISSPFRMSMDRESPQYTPADFAPGRPVRRSEDETLVRGRGRYTDDLRLDGQAYAAIVRSMHAHGIIRAIDTAAARAMPGVLAVYTGDDLLAAGVKPMPFRHALKNRDGSPMRFVERSVLARDKVRYVGDPVVCIVAATAVAAKDAAEAVVIDIEPLPAVTSASAAAAPGAPLVYDDVPGNVVLDFHFGDSAKVAAAFASAAHVTRLALTNNRLVAAAMEPRSVVASFDKAAGRYTARLPAQGVMGMRGHIAGALGVAPDKVRVLTGNVGGSFGMKAGVYPEYVCALVAARDLGRPVKWTDERSSAFLSDNHGRDHERVCELALAADGTFLAIRITGHANLGAGVAHFGPMPSCINAVKNSIGVYRTPLLEVATLCVLTNTSPVGPYRGAGRPESNYFLERLIDAAAREMGIDRLALRRRNHIRPSQIPYVAPSEQPYVSGFFPAVFKRAVGAADWSGFATRRRDSKKRGLLRGIGIGSYLEATAAASPESGSIRFEPDGTVTLLTGTLDQGQGHAAPFAQVLAGQLGIPFAAIRLFQGDSDALLAGGGTGGSRSIMASSTAIVAAAKAVIANGRKIATAVLEVAESDIEFADGRFVIAGTDRAIGLMELAAQLRDGLALPEGMPRTLDAGIVIDGVPSTFPNGCHVAEVEVDPATGFVQVARYTSVNDFGTIINPLLVDGQLQGGIVQGLGQILHERVVYDSDGQLLTGSFVDYGLPRAGDIPDLVGITQAAPAATNPLGVKGCGEAGCAGALVAVVNAIVDALAPLGITHVDLPVTPERLWRLIRDAETSHAA